MVTSAQIVGSEPELSPSTKTQLEERTFDLVALTTAILEQASNSQIVSEQVLTSLTASVKATLEGSNLLLPATVTPAPIPTLTATPTLTSTPTMTVAPSNTPETATTLIVEGPIEAIDNNVLTVYGFNIVLDAGDSLLSVIQVGDTIRAEGKLTQNGDDTSIILAQYVDFVNVETLTGDQDQFTNDRGQIWRDDGDCDNPPPSWAPAHGWRARCEGSPPPGNGGRNNSNRGNKR